MLKVKQELPQRSLGCFPGQKGEDFAVFESSSCLAFADGDPNPNHFHFAPYVTAATTLPSGGVKPATGDFLRAFRGNGVKNWKLFADDLTSLIKLRDDGSRATYVHVSARIETRACLCYTICSSVALDHQQLSLCASHEKQEQAPTRLMTHRWRAPTELVAPGLGALESRHNSTTTEVPQCCLVSRILCQQRNNLNGFSFRKALVPVSVVSSTTDHNSEGF